MLYSTRHWRTALLSLSTAPSILGRWTHSDRFDRLIHYPIWTPDVPRGTSSWSHLSHSITRSCRNCLRGISEPILRCYQTPVVARQAPKEPLLMHGGCVWEQDWCVQTRMKFRFPMQEQPGHLISVLFACLLIYWFIYSFWERRKIISKNSHNSRDLQSSPYTHMHTIITIILFTERSRRRG